MIGLNCRLSEDPECKSVKLGLKFHIGRVPQARRHGAEKQHDELFTVPQRPRRSAQLLSRSVPIEQISSIHSATAPLLQQAKMMQDICLLTSKTAQDY